MVFDPQLNIPILDLSQYQPNDPSFQADTDSFLEQLYTAMRDVGFFYIKNHGVSEKLQEDSLALTKAFFALPLEEKLKIETINSPHFRGYARVDSETTNYKQDHREQLDIAREQPPVSHDAPYYLQMQGPNQWPKDPPELKETILEFMDELTKVARLLLSAMVKSVKVIDHDSFMSMFTDDACTVRMKLASYPAGSVETSDGWGVGPHKDYGIVTVLMQDQVGGLQVQTHHGEWVDVTPIPNTFVVNIGEVFERLTRKRFVATTHRVKVSDKHRYSLPLFLGPRLDARIPELVDDGEPAQEVTDVKQDQLLQDPIYGVNQINGYLRSHKRVAARWYHYDEQAQEWKRRVTPFIA
ncbi:hypothetical protein LRAMOSA04167 [Lichtheimia ramosa]|uniref:Fe2OG dioxygenase domain-containing protein n=1 Tax=Lichtheimia ramosa TaxID=688394 RepID=A0A077WWJ3_9FUNG|nr:hypothetical protein LRAMOSA04167 [Lichtheimia ramosa]